MQDLDYLKKLQQSMMGIEPEQEVEIPFRPEDQIEQVNEQAESPYMKEAPKKEEVKEEEWKVPTADEIVEEVTGSPVKPELPPAPPKPVSKEDAFLAKLKKAQEQGKKDIQDSKDRDFKANLAGNLARALGSLGAASVQRSAKTKVGLQPFEAQRNVNTSKEAISERDKAIKDLYNQYRTLNTKKDELSAKDKAYLDYYNRALEQRKKGQENIAKRQQKSFEQKDVDRQIKAEDRVYKVIADYEKHPMVKELDKQGLSFDQADALVDQIQGGNQVALGALGTKMARAMGEVGVLTDADVKRYIQAQSLVQKAQDMYGRNFMGELSDETIRDIQQVTKKMRVGFGKKRKNLYDRYVKRAYENYGKQAGLSLEDIETKFAIPSMKDQKEAKKAPYGEVVERNGKQYKWNPSVGKYQILKGE
jgi:hypothetical protein